MIFLVSCSPTPPDWKIDIEDLIQKEKYSKALSILENRLSFKHAVMWKLSDSKNPTKRTIRLSENREIIVWSENNTLYRWTVKEDKIESKIFAYTLTDFQISANGQMVVLQHKVGNPDICKISAYSFTDPSLVYESESNLDCSSSFAISEGGNQILYFLENDLFTERTSLPKNPVRLLTESQYPAPFPKIKAKVALHPFSNDFLIFSGIGGAYSVSNFSLTKEKLSLLSKEIVSPLYYPIENQFGYLVTGKIGELSFQPLVVSNGKTILSKGFNISYSLVHSQKLSQKDTFLFASKDSPKGLVKWSLGSKKEALPIFVERFWVLVGDVLVYENKAGDLLAGSITFEENEWLAFNYYNRVKKLKEEEGN